MKIILFLVFAILFKNTSSMDLDLFSACDRIVVVVRCIYKQYFFTSAAGIHFVFEPGQSRTTTATRLNFRSFNSAEREENHALETIFHPGQIA